MTTPGVLPDIFGQIPELPRVGRPAGTNLAGARLARRLGFEAVALHRVLTRA